MELIFVPWEPTEKQLYAMDEEKQKKMETKFVLVPDKLIQYLEERNRITAMNKKKKTWARVFRRIKEEIKAEVKEEVKQQLIKEAKQEILVEVKNILLPSEPSWKKSEEKPKVTGKRVLRKWSEYSKGDHKKTRVWTKEEKILFYSIFKATYSPSRELLDVLVGITGKTFRKIKLALGCARKEFQIANSLSTTDTQKEIYTQKYLMTKGSFSGRKSQKKHEIDRLYAHNRFIASDHSLFYFRDYYFVIEYGLGDLRRRWKLDIRKIPIIEISKRDNDELKFDILSRGEKSYTKEGKKWVQDEKMEYFMFTLVVDKIKTVDILNDLFCTYPFFESLHILRWQKKCEIIK